VLSGVFWAVVFSMVRVLASGLLREPGGAVSRG
jgi:hypothetical protein